MEEEIDLRPYLRALHRRWWWIAGLALVGFVMAFALSSLRPTRYQASSVVLVAQSDAAVIKTLPTLATSDEVLQAVVDAYQPPADAPGQALTLAGLGGMVKATAGRDPSILALQVQAASPQVSAAIANLWADRLINRVNAIYYDTSADTKFLEDQAAQAYQALDKANTALVDFQGRSQVQTLGTQLKVQQAAQEAFLSRSFTITNTLRDIQDLRVQLAKQPAAAQVSLADSLTTVLLQLKAFNSDSAAPIQLQVNGAENLASMSRQEQLDFLENLITTLRNRSTDGEAQLAVLQPTILALQGRLQEAQTELANLTRTQKQAEQIYLAAASKVQDARVAAQKPARALRVGSKASVPQTPMGSNRLRNGLLGALLGLMLGVFAVIAAEWWKR